MNEKIPVNRLAQEVARAIGADTSEVQQFIKDLFAYVEAEVSAGSDVTVPGLGRFSKSTVSGEPIAFEPDAEYAAALNADFDMFSPVELNDGVTEEALDEAVKETVPESLQPAATDAEQEQEHEQENAPESPQCEPTLTETDIEEDVTVEIAEIPAEVPAEDSTATIEPPAREEPTEVVDEPVVAVENDAQVETLSEEIADSTPTEPETEPTSEPAAESASETAPTAPLIAPIPEQEEEYVIVHGRKSRFWVGFIIGLVLGFALGVIAFVAYLVNISVITPEKLFN